MLTFVLVIAKGNEAEGMEINSYFGELNIIFLMLSLSVHWAVQNKENEYLTLQNNIDDYIMLNIKCQVINDKILYYVG